MLPPQEDRRSRLSTFLPSAFGALHLNSADGRLYWPSTKDWQPQKCGSFNLHQLNLREASYVHNHIATQVQPLLFCVPAAKEAS